MNPHKKKSVVVAVVSLALLLLAYLVFTGITFKKRSEAAPVPPQPAPPQLVAFGNPSVESLPNEGKEITVPVIKKGEILAKSVKVVIYVYEKDESGLRDFSKSSISSKWSSPVDWMDGGIETVQISYPGPLEPNKESYVGYVIGLYYENVLQDHISEPKTLIEEFPLPNTVKGQNIR